MAKTRTSKVVPLEYDEDPVRNRYPVKKRGCRDIIFLILFIAFLGGMGYLALMSITQGDPYSLLYGVDSWGNVCNKGLTLGKTKSFFFDGSLFLRLLPSIPGLPLFNTSSFTGTKAVCANSCPDVDLPDTTAVAGFMNRTGSNLCHYNITGFVLNDPLCPDLPVKTHVSVMNRCVPQTYLTILQNATAQFSSLMSTFSIGPELTAKIASDVQNTWKEILYLAAIALGLSFVLVILMRFIAGIIVWTLMIGVILFAMGATGYCWYIYLTTKKAFEQLDSTLQTSEGKTKVTTWLVYSSVTSAVTLIVLLVLLVMRKRIVLVVKLFQEAGKAIGKMPFLLLVPIYTMIMLAVAVGGLLIIAVFMETIGTPFLPPMSPFVSYTREQYWTFLRWYHYFGLLWVTAFVLACEDLFIAGAVVHWYFRDTPTIGWPMLASIRTLICYHLGSLAFGSLLIAFVRFIRLILALVHKKLRVANNRVAQACMRIIQCCLWCIEKFIVFLNRNAYIEIAIYGEGFCRAARRALQVIISNALRMAAINSVGDILLFLGKIAPIGAVIVAGHLMLKDRDDINIIWVPITVASLLAFLIGHCFFTVYEMVVDTIFLCFCEDCTMNDATGEYYMSKNLMMLLNKSAARPKQLRDRDNDAENASPGKVQKGAIQIPSPKSGKSLEPSHPSKVVNSSNSSPSNKSGKSSNQTKSPKSSDHSPTAKGGKTTDSKKQAHAPVKSVKSKKPDW